MGQALTAPAAKAPANGEAAMMAATTTFFTIVTDFRMGVYRMVRPAEVAITERSDMEFWIVPAGHSVRQTQDPSKAALD